VFCQLRYPDCETIQKYLAAKDAKSANNKHPLVSLRYFASFAAKSFQADGIIRASEKSKL
jgi:hypothetical protein